MLQVICIPISLKDRCDDSAIPFSSLEFGFFSLFSALFNGFVAYDQYLIAEAFFPYIIQPPLIKICEYFLCIFHHLESSFVKSSLIKLSFFDSKVS